MVVERESLSRFLVERGLVTEGTGEVLDIIIEEAGGRFTDIRGDARIDGGSIVTTNGLVHDAVLEYFR